MVVGGVLVAAGFVVGGMNGNSGRAVAESPRIGMMEGLPAAEGCPNGGFAIVAGANGKYFFVDENAKVRALSTDGGELIIWK